MSYFEIGVHFGYFECVRKSSIYHAGYKTVIECCVLLVTVTDESTCLRFASLPVERYEVCEIL